MSAYMVSKTHIDLLLKVAIDGPSGVRPRLFSFYWQGQHLEFGDLDQINAIGGMLVQENLASIHARYPDTIENPDNTPGPIARYWDDPYEFEDPAYRPSVVETLQAIRCYEYQSCEHEGWEASNAHRFVDSLRHCLIACLPGMDDAPWEWTPDTLAQARQKHPDRSAIRYTGKMR